MYVYLQCPLLTENKPRKLGLPTSSNMFCSFHHFAPQIYIYIYLSTCMIFKTTLAKQSYFNIFQPEHHNLLKKTKKNITLAASLEFHPCSIFSSYFMTPKRPPPFFMFSPPPKNKNKQQQHTPCHDPPDSVIKGTELWRSFGRFPMTHPTSGGTENNLRFFGSLKMKRCKMFQEKKNGR